jgi:putative membrane protein
MLDLILAGLHHLAVFTLVGVFAAEFAVLRSGLEGRRLGQLSALDRAYGATAGIVVVVGIVRVIFGNAGWEFYVFNWVFWLKMAAFAGMGLASIPPTMTILNWRKALAADGAYDPSPAEIARVRGYLFAEIGFLALVPLFAAAMARGYGAF